MEAVRCHVRGLGDGVSVTAERLWEPGVHPGVGKEAQDFGKGSEAGWWGVEGR